MVSSRKSPTTAVLKAAISQRSNGSMKNVYKNKKGTEESKNLNLTESSND